MVVTVLGEPQRLRVIVGVAEHQTLLKERHHAGAVVGARQRCCHRPDLLHLGRADLSRAARGVSAKAAAVYVDASHRLQCEGVGRGCRDLVIVPVQLGHADDAADVDDVTIKERMRRGGDHHRVCNGRACDCAAVATTIHKGGVAGGVDVCACLILQRERVGRDVGHAEVQLFQLHHALDVVELDLIAVAETMPGHRDDARICLRDVLNRLGRQQWTLEDRDHKRPGIVSRAGQLAHIIRRMHQIHRVSRLHETQRRQISHSVRCGDVVDLSGRAARGVGRKRSRVDRIAEQIDQRKGIGRRAGHAVVPPV